MKKVLDFKEENLKGLYFYMNGLNFPVALATYSEWEETQVSYLSNNVKSEGFNTESLCRWCISHNIQYRIVYPIKKSSIFKNPYKYLKFLQLKRKLKYSL